MPRSTALAKGARITGGTCCLLLFLYTAFWLGHDFSEFGATAVWDAWTGRGIAGTNAVSNSTQCGLAVVQLSAVIAAFAGRRAAGGLLAVATTLTFATAVQTMISTGNHTGDNRWFLKADMAAGPFEAVFLGSLALFLLSFLAGIVLLCGMRSWPRPTPSAPPLRPAKAASVLCGLVLGGMALCSVIWQITMLVQGGGADAVTVLYLGKGVLTSLTALAPGWYALVILALTGIGALSSLLRGGAARGLAMGLATVLLPNAVLTVIALADNGTLFRISDSAPGLSILSTVQWMLDLLGSLALFALMGKGEPVASGWQPPAPALQFAVPGFVPPGPQGPPQAAWQQPFPPQPGPVPPAPPAGVPPMPPGNPPVQGGFGPPQY
ncbi:hypothetical protein [Streptomyces pinistramenti]|uniref:hypothetical protein n=1 Tax=Streptomyces pinistramenti TaxID=2884812 RepID=UPI001D063254|nr:hypothetical protein [Streptomyces pinistramenti]MCB5908025.1 hypothetical protein [Streptomyces pinistramenti]